MFLAISEFLSISTFDKLEIGLTITKKMADVHFTRMHVAVGNRLKKQMGTSFEGQA